MKPLMKCLSLVTLLTALNFSTPPANAQDTAASVQDANARFYTALNAMFAGDLEPMKTVWSHADDVTYMGPDGGFQIRWNQVLADLTKQAALKLGGKVEPSEAVINLGTDVVVCHNWEKGQNVQDGKTVVVSIRATNIFRLEEGKWKMIGHHTDVLPFLED